MSNGKNQNNSENKEIISWCDKYATGIDQIDKQHRHLVVLTNQLYSACFAPHDVLESVFKEAMSRMVEYVRFHFNDELKLLKAINYPDYQNHKKMHDTLVNNILDTVKSYNEGKNHIPNNFVRTLVDWVFSHIAFYDKQYSLYVTDQIRVGALSKDKLKVISAEG